LAVFGWNISNVISKIALSCQEWSFILCNANRKLLAGVSLTGMDGHGIIIPCSIKNNLLTKCQNIIEKIIDKLVIFAEIQDKGRWKALIMVQKNNFGKKP